MTESAPKTDDLARVGDLVIEIELSHDQARVWRGLVEEIGIWWPDAFFSGGEPGSRQIRLEAEPGGRMLELWDGGGLLWGTVLTVNPERRLDVVGYVSPQWGGPGMWIGEWTLERAGGNTRLRFRESALGRMDESYVASKEKGWTYLFDVALRAHLEGTEPAPWVD